MHKTVISFAHTNTPTHKQTCIYRHSHSKDGNKIVYSFSLSLPLLFLPPHIQTKLNTRICICTCICVCATLTYSHDHTYILSIWRACVRSCVRALLCACMCMCARYRLIRSSVALLPCQHVYCRRLSALLWLSWRAPAARWMLYEQCAR